MTKMKRVVALVLVLVMMGGALTCAVVASAQATQGNGREWLVYVLSQDEPIRVSKMKVEVNNGVVTARRMDGRRVIWSPCEWVRIDDAPQQWIDPQPYDAEQPPATKPWRYR